ncbi:MAG: hypothetical protein QOF84_750 [Streptomyces sp.]|nr:hypothetical protein [Streptomyces sp.]
MAADQERSSACPSSPVSRILQSALCRRPYFRAPAACWWARSMMESTGTAHRTVTIASSLTWTYSSNLAHAASVDSPRPTTRSMVGHAVEATPLTDCRLQRFRTAAG